jgi:hypothetical protein
VLHRLEGTPSRLVIGVRRASDRKLAPIAAIDAHAWVDDLEAPKNQGFAAILVLDEAGVHAPPRSAP